MEVLDFDPRLLNLPTIRWGPTPPILLTLAYVLYVTILGPAWMKNRKPYNLRGLLICHNFALVVISAWMFYKFGKHGWFWRYSWTCANIDYLETEDSMQMVYVCYVFYLSKFIHMADTVFLVLRKKNSQITFLHVVHHSVVPIMLWYQGRIGASGFNTLFGFLNSFSHIWVYLYCGLVAIGPSLRKYLWWKKYITIIEIVQCVIMLMAPISAIVTPGCKIPWKMILHNLVLGTFFLVLFVNFYRSTYMQNSGKNEVKSSENGADHKLHTKNSEELNGYKLNNNHSD